MSGALLLARADALSTRHHLVESLGGHRWARAAVIAAAAALIGYNVFTHSATAALLGGLTASDRAAQLVLPLLPIVLALPAYGMALVIWILLPVDSPSGLHARLLGASRWYGGVSRFLPMALLVTLLATGGLVGSFVFVATLSDDLAAALGVQLALAAVCALTCCVVVQVVERAASVLRLSPREARLAGTISAVVGLIALLADVLRWAATAGRPTGPSLVGALIGVFGRGVPDSWSLALILTVLAAALVAVGCVASTIDPAAGRLQTAVVRWQAPPARSFRGQQIVVEVMTLLREPASRISFAAMVALVGAIAVAARTTDIDPGALLLLMVLVCATGGELVVGRSLPLNWLLRAWGVSLDGVLWLRLGVAAALFTFVFIIGFFAAGLAAAGPGRTIEAFSLHLAVLSLACLAGAVLPFDDRAPLGMLATSLLSIGLEFAVVVLVTTVLRLEGAPFVAADLIVTAAAVVLLRIRFRRLAAAAA